jgi:small subunit ribosomal protein S18
MADEPTTENENTKEVAETNGNNQVEQKKETKSEESKPEGEKKEAPRSGGDRRQSGGYRQGGGRQRGGGGYRQGGRQGGGYRQGGGRFRSRRKVCSFCVDKVKSIDWKNVDAFRRYMNNNGSIRARRKTGTCAKHQRQLATAIKRARHLALTPYTDEHARFMGKN